MTIWVCPKMMGKLPNHGGFHEINHPFWGEIPLFLVQHPYSIMLSHQISLGNVYIIDYNDISNIYFTHTHFIHIYLEGFKPHSICVSPRSSHYQERCVGTFRSVCSVMPRRTLDPCATRKGSCPFRDFQTFVYVSSIAFE